MKFVILDVPFIDVPVFELNFAKSTFSIFFILAIVLCAVRSNLLPIPFKH